MELRTASAKDVAESIVLSKQVNGLGRTIFFIGAGCSVSAGIPTAPQIAQWMVRDVSTKFGDANDDDSPETCYGALIRKGRLRDLKSTKSSSSVDWYSIYDECFERFYRSPDQVRELFSKLIEMSGGAINWAHLCLGELVARRLVGTVLTTNFDQLVLAGMAAAGTLPVVSDGLESLNRLSPNPAHPQLVEIHGSRHTYRLRNRPDEVQSVREQNAAISAIMSLFGFANTFVAVGYGGRENGVMDLLIAAAANYPDKNVFWISHSDNPGALSPKVHTFLSSSMNSAVIAGTDADEFFLALCSELGVGSPSCIRKPLATYSRFLEGLSKSEVNAPDIRNEIDSARRLAGFLSKQYEHFISEQSIDNKIDEVRRLRMAGEASKAYDLVSQLVKSDRRPSDVLLREAVISSDAYVVELSKLDVIAALRISLESLDLIKKLSRRKNSSQEDKILLSHVYSRVSSLYRDSGDLIRAKEFCEEVVRLDKSFLKSDPTNLMAMRTLSISYLDLGIILEDCAAPEEARAAYEKCADIRESMAQDIDNIEASKGLSSVYDRLGNWHFEHGTLEKAEEYYVRASKLDEEIENAEGLESNVHDLTVGRNKIAHVMTARGDFQGALTILEETLTLRQIELTNAPDDPSRAKDVAFALDDIAYVLDKMEKFADAIEKVDQAIVLLRRNAERNKTNMRAKRDLSVMLFRAGALLDSHGRSEDSLTYLEESVKLDRELAQDPKRPIYNQDLAKTLFRLAVVNFGLKRMDAVRSYTDEAIEVISRVRTEYEHNSHLKSDMVRVLELGAMTRAFAGETADATAFCDACRVLLDELANSGFDEDFISQSRSSIEGLMETINSDDVARE